MTTRLFTQRIGSTLACHRICLRPTIIGVGKSCRLSQKYSQRAEYIHIEDAEDPNGYRHGGYHPICPGDELHQRYRVVHKLGHGSFSTVWLATDHQQSGYVAIKVGTADTDWKEADLLSGLTKTIRGNCQDLVPVILDRFAIQGPSGTHPCIVTLPARCSLRDAKNASGSSLLQLEVARSLAAQLASAVASVHSHGVAHADLHLGNMLLRLPPGVSNLDLVELYARYGEPTQVPVLCASNREAPSQPGVPSYLIPAVWLGLPSDQLRLSEARLTLSDFGVAFKPADKSRFKSYTPLAYRPPEATFEPTTPLTLASDIWSLGCVIFELFAHRSLVDTAWFAEEDEVMAQRVELQGKMPAAWWDSWDERSKWYDEAGNPLREPDSVWSWQRRFENWVQKPREEKNVGTLEPEEQDAFLDLLKQMLSWRPEQRPTAQQVLESPWMRRWAFPAYQRTLHTVS